MSTWKSRTPDYTRRITDTLRAHIGKFILLVEPTEGKLSQMSSALESLGFELLFVNNAAEATDRIGDTPLLSLVVIDDAIGGPEGNELLTKVKDLHVDLPVLWLCTQLAPAPTTNTGCAPDVLLQHPVNVEALNDAAERLLHQHLYPPALTTHIVACCIDSMRAAYNTELTLTATHIRANGLALGPVTGVLPFVGEAISGRLLVSSHHDVLCAIRERAFKGTSPPSSVDGEDLAGEYANLITGRIKTHFARHDLAFALGTPIIVVGETAKLAYRASRPALVLTFAGIDGTIHVAFYFDLLNREQEAPISANASARGAEVDAGQLRFL